MAVLCPSQKGNTCFIRIAYQIFNLYIPTDQAAASSAVAWNAGPVVIKILAETKL